MVDLLGAYINYKYIVSSSKLNEWRYLKTKGPLRRSRQSTRSWNIDSTGATFNGCAVELCALN